MSRRNQWLLAVAALVVLALMGFGLYKAFSGGGKTTHKAPKITLIPTTPPPQPPPPKEERKPDPPKEQKEVRVDQPAPPKDAAPAAPSQELKMEGAAGEGPSAFGAGKVTRDDLSNLGKGSGGPATPGGMFNPFNNYATLLKGEVQRHLARNRELRQRAYRVDVQVWVGRDGSLSRHELLGGSGDADLDELIRQGLASLEKVSQTPPERMPQPIRLRLTTGR